VTLTAFASGVVASDMTELVVKVILSYLLGSIVGSLLVGRLRGGVDIRRLGSGNAGGTNALRTQGRAFAFWVMAIDIGKGWLATGVLARFLIPGLSHRKWVWMSIVLRGATDAVDRHREQLASQQIPHWFDPVQSPGWLGVACGIAAILGHVYPIFYGFRGGKGVATLIGAVLGLNPWLLAPMLAAWLLAVILWGFVGLASILATVALAATAVMGVLSPHLPLSANYGLYALGVVGPQLPLFVFGVLAALLIAFTHRSNIARMRAGTEPRARRLWLFGTRSRGA
jgi:acyl phosphate:glycerol-3-phosphate acyltransferase